MLKSQYLLSANYTFTDELLHFGYTFTDELLLHNHTFMDELCEIAALRDAELTRPSPLGKVLNEVKRMRSPHAKNEPEVPLGLETRL